MVKIRYFLTFKLIGTKTTCENVEYFTILTMRLFVFYWVKNGKFSLFSHNFLVIWLLEMADLPIWGRIQLKIQILRQNYKILKIQSINVVIAFSIWKAFK